MKTKVINLYAGSGAGKSTLGAEIFAYFKRQGKDIELVREYVKNWAWEGKKIGPLDQIYILGKQLKAEKTLYGKVEYIVTDSPILLCGFYDQFYSKRENFTKYLQAINEEINELIIPCDFFVQRTKIFNPKGRYETEEQAKQNDVLIQDYLNKYFDKSPKILEDNSMFSKNVYEELK